MRPAVIVVLVLLALAGALLLVLIGLVTGRKALRDRREAGSHARRRRYREALRGGSRRRLKRVLRWVRTPSTELDLLAALDAFAGRPPDLAVAAERAGLLAHLERRLASREASARGRAVLLLGRVAPDAAMRLQPALEDPDPDVRLVACAALAASRDPASVEVLLRALEDGRLAAERVIERLGTAWAVDALVAAIEREDAGPVRRVACVRALGLAADPRSEPTLIDVLETGGEEERISAARSLAALAGPDAREPLEAALDDASWPLRAQAAKALGALAAVESLDGLEARLSDDAWWVRANAAHALLRLGDPGIAALERAAGHPDAYARDRALEALAMTRVGAVA